jgi:hypothetical protein
VQVLLPKSHPYLGRPPNNSPQLTAALVYLDLSSSSSNRTPKANKEILGHLETIWCLDRQTQCNLNRVDVGQLLQPTLLAISITQNSIWRYSGSTACYGTGMGGGLFRNVQQQGSQPSTFGLFGNKTTTPTSGGGRLFGNNTTSQTSSVPNNHLLQV